MCAKKVIFGILLHVVAEMVDMQKSISDDSEITCDEIIGMRKSIMTKTASTKNITTNFNKKR